MVQQLNGKEVKEKILKYLLEKGPELPVHIAKHMSMNSIFASAFLSEMASEGMIKISDMKVGGSPVYYEPSTVAFLERYTNSLGGKEKEACLLLKEKGILEDSSQTPAIRVALRGLKDFAFPFKNDEKAFWRYFLISEDEVRKRLDEKPQIIEKIEEKPIIEKEKIEEKIEMKAEQIIEHEERKNQEIEKINEELDQKRKELEQLKQEIESKSKETNQIKKPVNEKISKKLKLIRKEKLLDETFLTEIKQILEKKKIELIKIENFDKKQVTAKIRLDNQEILLIALNKKKIEDEEIIKISKLANSHKLQYMILFKSDVSKKTKETIDAFKKLVSIERID